MPREIIDDIVNSLQADGGAEHILRLIDAELKSTLEYKQCNNDPKKVLAVAYSAKKGQLPKKITYRAVGILRTKLDALFGSLPRTRGLTFDPKKALAVAFHAKQGQETKRIDNRAVINLKTKHLISLSDYV